MTPLIRYSLLQLPGLLLIASLGWWAWSSGWVSAGTAVALFLVWLLKDALLYPLYRPALERQVPCGGQALVGRHATVITALHPVGRVRVDGESWRARSAHGEPVPAGRGVRVIDAEGLTLTVEPID
ncbi:NfeD family protein [Alkalilimnicola ehrlichii MLHE-1]|uniref:NfeD-like C-terminal domain-containing protein n=1 Tax=Alkalilimnicola ehrlichii (strain ATCC BAA-1101 / DSM 17681 / MLHE-1) TaxID=187272 RepID=Q0AA67_ALKEH|nr:NfeD family protein [Alkalilimnicola ehrlichii]ABI56270.1 protein of unknown function DUF107 [Alkalilimnicola ehrlichii MLHE-1]